MQYIYILDYSTPSRVTIEVDDNIDVEEKIDDILSVNNLKASACYLKEGRIEVRCTINPTFKPKEAKRAKPKKKEPKTHKYYFRMYTESDPEDGESVWAEAYSESDARDIIYNDFHSITDLDLIRVE